MTEAQEMLAANGTPATTWSGREVFVRTPTFYLRLRPEDLIVVEEAGFDTRCPVTMEAQADALAVILGMMTMCGNA